MRLVIVIIIALIGVYVFFAPVFKKTNDKIKKKKAKKLFHSLEDDFELNEEKDINQYDLLFDDMLRYNEAIYENEQKGLTGELPKYGVVFDTGKNLTINLFAMLKFTHKKRKSRKGVSKIKEKTIPFPIYLSSSRQNLQSGFVTMPYTSMPIGGKNTLSVLCGYAKESLFNKKTCFVSIGDRIILQNPFEQLSYVVYEIGAVDKEDTDILRIADDETELVILMFLPRRKTRVGIFARILDDIEQNQQDDEYSEEYLDEDDDFDDEYDDEDS